MFFLIITCNQGGQKNYLLHMKAEIRTEYHDLKSQELMKNHQISSKWCAASAAVSVNVQSRTRQCGSPARATDVLGWFLLGFASSVGSLAFEIKNSLPCPCAGCGRVSPGCREGRSLSRSLSQVRRVWSHWVL